MYQIICNLFKKLRQRDYYKLINFFFQLMGAYMTLLAHRNSSNTMYLHFSWFSQIVNGKTEGQVLSNGTAKKMLYFTNEPFLSRMLKSYEFISVYHKGSSHWVFVHIDVKSFRITYIDPFGHPPPQNFLLNWDLYWRKFSSLCMKKQFVGNFQFRKTVPHSRQMSSDTRNCGLYSLGVS